ncbi:MAG: hypothetical protein FWG88_02665 [Oscillospiraceae bacterium]|nr:hypothetical protein [Oscillospiraceae bacterium]
MKKSISIILAVAMCITLLAACGSGGNNGSSSSSSPNNSSNASNSQSNSSVSPSSGGNVGNAGSGNETVQSSGNSIAADHPILGTWIAYTADIFGDETDIRSFYAQGATLELKANGECTTIFNGNDAKGSWTMSGSTLSYNIGGAEYAGSYESDVVMFEVLDDIFLYFTKDGNPPAGGGAISTTDFGPSIGERAIGHDWWDGHWYGSFYLYDGNEAYEDEIGYYDDLYAVIDVTTSGRAIMYIWTDSMSLGTVHLDITISEDGQFHQALAVGGDLFNEDVKQGEWLIMPTVSRYANMIEIDQIFADIDGDWFKYEILLRPWGMDWDDVPDYDQPYWYEDWYLGIMHLPMLDVLTDLGTLHPELY